MGLFSKKKSSATVSGSGADAHTSNGGKAIAISNGKGAKGHAVSSGEYAESVAIGR